MFYSLYQQQQERTSPRKKGGGITGEGGKQPLANWPVEYQRGLKAALPTQYQLLITAPASTHPKASPPPETPEADMLPEGEPAPELPYLATLSLDLLARLPQTTQHRRLVSAQGWSIKAQWQGVLLKDLIIYLGLDFSSAALPITTLIQVNAAQWEECLPLEALLAEEALLCTQVDGVPLPALHGGPLRLIGFTRYSYKSLCNLSELHFTPYTKAGYWSVRGYDDMGIVQPGSYYLFDSGEMAEHKAAGEFAG